jgi:hypothetical protein
MCANKENYFSEIFNILILLMYFHKRCLIFLNKEVKLVAVVYDIFLREREHRLKKTEYAKTDLALGEKKK